MKNIGNLFNGTATSNMLAANSIISNVNRELTDKMDELNAVKNELLNYTMNLTPVGDRTFIADKSILQGSVLKFREL